MAPRRSSAFPQETAKLRKLTQAGHPISWEVPHARKQAKDRDVPLFVAERIVRSGAVTDVMVEPSGVERWRVSGRDEEGRPIDVVVVEVEASYLRVITVIRTDE